MKTHRRTVRVAFVAIIAAFGLTAVACTPPGGPAAVNWSFRGTHITVNKVQDEVCVVFCVNTSDEPYLLQVAFRVKIGLPNSAQAFVVKGGTIQSLSVNQSANLDANTGAQVNFNGVQPLDILDTLDTNNHLEVVGTYTWASEEDTIDSLTGGAQSIADIFKTALNGTLAASSLPSDSNGIINLILGALFNNGFGTPFNLILSNIPCLGLCDDVLGGGLYVGIGATGTLGAGLDAILGSLTIPTFNIPIVDVPPDIQGGGIYTMTGAKSFTNTFSGADGIHTYNFLAGPA